MILEKTWQYAINQEAFGADQAEAAKKVLFSLKENLVGNVARVGAAGTPVTAHALWTVVGSSNGVTAGLDGADRWTSHGNVIFGYGSGSSRSWILLKHPTEDMWFLIDHMSTGGSSVYYQSFFYVFFSAPTGGASPSSPPEPSNGVKAGKVQNFLSSTASTVSYRTHFMIADDGAFHFLSSIAGGGRVNWALSITKVKDSEPEDQYPWFMFLPQFSTATTGNLPLDKGTMSSTGAGANFWGLSQSGAAQQVTGIMACFQGRNDDALSFPTFGGRALQWEFALSGASPSTGYRGIVPDWKIGPSNGPINMVSPATGQPTAILLGEVWLPAYSGLLL